MGPFEKKEKENQYRKEGDGCKYALTIIGNNNRYLAADKSKKQCYTQNNYHDYRKHGYCDSEAIEIMR